jgi:hypothetical protein
MPSNDHAKEKRENISYPYILIILMIVSVLSQTDQIGWRDLSNHVLVAGI